jgi:hypothetical protein
MESFDGPLDARYGCRTTGILHASERMEEWRTPPQRSAAQLRAQAAVYRRMAKTASTTPVIEGLMRIADRYDLLAETREERDATRPMRG